MPNYRRYYVPGGTYFFTLVTEGRKPLFREEHARTYLREALETIRKGRPLEIVAFCLLPEHFHTVWTLPRGDSDYSTRWRRIKEEFTESWLGSGGSEATRSASKQAKGERGVWQRRFWEHTVRDEADLKRCVDYVHWNPVKHGLVTSVKDWPWSSFHRFVEEGEYELDWGRTDPCPMWEDPEWGE